MSNYIGGTSSKDILIGSAEDEYLYGYQGADTLKGGGGKDSLDGGDGADTMMGGAGDDLYFVDDAGDVVKEFAAEGIDEVVSWVNYTLTANVENLHLQGSAAIGVGNDLNNRLLGNAVDNTLKGGGGDDYINGGGGLDTAIGGSGNDEYTVDQTSDVVIEFAGEGTDIIWSLASYTLPANVEDLALSGLAGSINGTGNELDNHIYGNDKSNVLVGAAGNDFLHAGHSLSPEGNVLDGDGVADTLIGGVGDDTYRISAAYDLIIEDANEGRDKVIASFTYTLGPNLEDLTLENSGGAINGTGNAANNAISGNCYANVLSGLGGNDVILGDGGTDTLIGGAGADSFVWEKTIDTGLTTNSADVITDFSFMGGDRIDLHAIDANVIASGDQAFSFIGTAVFSGAPGEIRYYHFNGDTYLEMQTGTSVDVEGVVRLTGIQTPEASWFLL